jgi:hypothetical protein
MAAKLFGTLDFTGGAASTISRLSTILQGFGWEDQAVAARTVLKSGESSAGLSMYVEFSVVSTKIQVEAGYDFSGSAFVGNTMIRQSSGSGGSGSALLYVDTSWFMYFGNPLDTSPSLQEPILGAGVINPVASGDPNHAFSLGEYTEGGGPWDVVLTGKGRRPWVLLSGQQRRDARS